MASSHLYHRAPNSCRRLAVDPSPFKYLHTERFGSYSLTSQTGTHLLLQIVPAIHEAEHGTPKDKTAEQMHERLNARLAEMGKTRDQLTSFEISLQLTQLAVELLKDTSAMAMAKRG